MLRTYSELIRIPSFEDRFEYAKLGGAIGAETFGYDRYLNQIFYRSKEWRQFRHSIIIRDQGCDLAHEDREIHGRIIVVHHLNPITVEDVLSRSPALFDPENVVAIDEITHKAVHYGDYSLIIPSKLIERKPFDTCPWR